jgi:hypothetical protein
MVLSLAFSQAFFETVPSQEAQFIQYSEAQTGQQSTVQTGQQSTVHTAQHSSALSLSAQYTALSLSYLRSAPELSLTALLE